jgi:hypothetical protein
LLRGETLNITLPSKAVIVIHADFTEWEYALTRLRQHVDREVDMRIDVAEDELVIWHPATKRAEEIVTALRLLLTQKLKRKATRRALSLFGVGVEERTAFFLKLFELEGFKVEDVKRVRVARPNREAYPASPGDEDDDDDGASMPPTHDEKRAVGLVRQVTLDGAQLTTTSEYQELTRKGVCINHAIWVVHELKNARMRYELMAGFANAYNATRFHYAVRQVWEPREDSATEYTKRARMPTEGERLEMGRAIESSAKKAAAAVAPGSWEIEDAEEADEGDESPAEQVT